MGAQSNLGSVVVGCDGSWQSQAAVQAATREAARRGCRLVLLAVARRDRMPRALAELRDYAASTLELARAVGLRAAGVARMTDPEVPARVVVAESVDGQDVADAVRGAALLVVGGAGGRGQTAFSLGSTSRDLTRRFRTPVLVPRLDGPGRRPIDGRNPQVIVGWSGRGREGTLLRLAAQEARLRGWPLCVVHAVPHPHPGQPLAGDLEATWQAVHAVPESAEVPCQVEVALDDAVTALVSRCGPEDVLLVATRGGGTLAGLVPGSVARGVLDELPCDVIVVPPAAELAPARALDPAGAATETVAALGPPAR